MARPPAPQRPAVRPAPRVRLGATAITALAVLAFPGDAGAKVTCQQRGVEGSGVEVSGLPAAPVAAHRYELTVTVGTADAIGEAPQLAVLSCPSGHRGDYDWLRATPTDDPLTFTVEMSFLEPGRYAMSVVGRGQVHDAGLHDVVPAAAATGESASMSSSASRSSGPPGSLWVGAAAALAAVVAASSVAVRRRRSP